MTTWPLILYGTMGLLAMLLAVTLGVIFSRNLLVTVGLLSIFSLLMSLLYLFMGAPDVAMTEAAVGAGISTLLFLGGLLVIGEKSSPKRRFSIGAAAVSLLAGALLLYVVSDTAPYGSAQSPANRHVGPAYTASTYNDMGVENVVTATLASYRGYDTYGETTVILTAVLAVYLLLGAARSKRA